MHLLNNKKWCRYETCRIHLERYQNKGENLQNNIITVDETWVRAYEPELKRQSTEWRHEGSPRRQKFRQNPSPVNLIVILAYDLQGVILCHMVKMLMHSTMLHICKIIYIVQLGTNGQNCKANLCQGSATMLKVGSTGASTILTGPFAL